MRYTETTFWEITNRSQMVGLLFCCSLLLWKSRNTNSLDVPFCTHLHFVEQFATEDLSQNNFSVIHFTAAQVWNPVMLFFHLLSLWGVSTMHLRRFRERIGKGNDVWLRATNYLTCNYMYITVVSKRKAFSSPEIQLGQVEVDISRFYLVKLQGRFLSFTTVVRATLLVTFTYLP